MAYSPSFSCTLSFQTNLQKNSDIISLKKKSVQCKPYRYLATWYFWYEAHLNIYVFNVTENPQVEGLKSNKSHYVSFIIKLLLRSRWK